MFPDWVSAATARLSLIHHAAQHSTHFPKEKKQTSALTIRLQTTLICLSTQAVAVQQNDRFYNTITADTHTHKAIIQAAAVSCEVINPAQSVPAEAIQEDPVPNWVNVPEVGHS